MPLTNADYSKIKVIVAQRMYQEQNWFPGHAPAGTNVTYYQIPENSQNTQTYNIVFTAAGAFDDNDTIELVGENHYISSNGVEFDAF